MAMLFKKVILEKIASGDVQLAFRRWLKPTVKTGTRIHTSLGIVAIGKVTPVRLSALSEEDARLAGQESLTQLKSELNSRPEGAFYRIQLRHEGADPRIALRAITRFSAPEKEELISGLERLEKRNPHGAWVKKVLELIRANPGLKASELAKLSGMETAKLKIAVRKLKNFGLAISLETGYRISPRGAAILKSL